MDYVALTTDIWSASTKSNRPFCVYSVHFIHKETLNYAILDFRRLPHPHTASALRDNLQELFDYYDINTKIFAITADGASNNRASIRLLNGLN